MGALGGVSGVRPDYGIILFLIIIFWVRGGGLGYIGLTNFNLIMTFGFSLFCLAFVSTVFLNRRAFKKLMGMLKN